MKRLCHLLGALFLGAGALFADRDWGLYPDGSSSPDAAGAVGSRLKAVDDWALSPKAQVSLFAALKKSACAPELPWAEANADHAAYHALLERTPSRTLHDDGRLFGAWLSYLAARAPWKPAARPLAESAVRALLKEREKPEATFLNLPPHWFWPPPVSGDGKKAKKRPVAPPAAPAPAKPPVQPLTRLGAYATVLRGVTDAAPVVADLDKAQEAITAAEGDATKAKKAAKRRLSFGESVVKQNRALADWMIWRMNESPDQDYIRKTLALGDGDALLETYHRLARAYGDGYWYDGSRCWYWGELLDPMKEKSLDLANASPETVLAAAAFFARLDWERGDFGAFVASGWVFDQMTNAVPRLSARAAADFCRLAACRFRLDGNVRFHDALEDALLNRALPCILPGKAPAFASAVPAARPVALAPAADPRVQADLMRLVAELPTYSFSYREANDKEPRWVCVNQFWPASLRDEKLGLSLSVAGDYPLGDRTELKLALDAGEQTFALRLRHPDGCGTNATLTVNGTERFPFIRDWTGYHHLPRKWKDGDTIAVDFDFTVRPVRHADGTASFRWGPNLLAAVGAAAPALPEEVFSSPLPASCTLTPASLKVGSLSLRLKPVLSLTPRDKATTLFPVK